MTGDGCTQAPRKQSVSNRPGDRNAAGMQVHTDPALRVIGEVFGVMAPPRPVIVPEVVVGVVADASDDLGVAHGAC